MLLLAQKRSFFFQAEDGIRDGRVTGVQTCALPISQAQHGSAPDIAGKGLANPASLIGSAAMLIAWLGERRQDQGRSEERRVGEESGAEETPRQKLKAKGGT